MGFRSCVSLAISAIAAGFLLPIPTTGQTHPGLWNPPLAPDGHVELQGVWENRSATPLERPRQLEGRALLTEPEVAELKARAARIFRDGYSDMPAGDDFFLAALANLERYKRASSTGESLYVEREWDNRTSMIVDPPDGRIPPYTPEGQQRRSAAAVSPPVRSQDLTNAERCITWGVPMLRPNPYPNHYQIVQTREHVVLVMEMIHEARVIPLDGRPHLPPDVRTWNGDSRGRWEGNTLVVDTANFSAKTNFIGSAENLHLVERFTRVAPDEIRYEVTVDDRSTWIRPWTAVVRLKESHDRIYEFACHEGNQFVVEGILGASRADDAEKHQK